MSNLELLVAAIQERGEELKLDFPYILEQLLESILKSTDNSR